MERSVKLKKKVLLLLGMLSSKRSFCGPVNVNINILSGECSSRCVMCNHYSGLLEKSKKDVKFFPIRLMKKFLLDLAGMPVECVTFCADGEPFLYPDIAELLEFLKNIDIKYRFLTNGFSIKEEHMDFFDKKASLRLSIHAGSGKIWSDITGLPEERFPGLIHKIKKIKDTGAKVIFHSVICRKNYRDLPGLIDLANHCKIDELSIGPLTVSDDAIGILKLNKYEFREFKKSIVYAAGLAAEYGIANNFTYFMGLEHDNKGSFSAGRLYKRMPCYVGWLFTWIDIDGNVKFCCNSGEPLGNILKDSFKDIWHSPGYDKSRYLAKKTEKVSADCDCSECANYMVNMKMDNMLNFYKMRKRHEFI